MFEYVNAKDVSGKPFTIISDPIQVFTSSFEYSKEQGYEADPGLPRKITAYLVDETKAPYETVITTDEETGEEKEVKNLVWYQEGVPIPLDYNFFNFPAEAVATMPDGTEKTYRRKWLDRRYRVDVVFEKPVKVKAWDKEAGKEVEKEITHAKVDIPTGLYANKLASALEMLREVKENPEIKLSDCAVTVKFDKTKPPTDMYSVKVIERKEAVNIEEEAEAFKKEKKMFEAPSTPF